MAAADECSNCLRCRCCREDATFVDPTVAARPRSELALQFYSLQHLFSSVQVSSIGQPEVHLAPQPGGPSLLEVRRAGLLLPLFRPERAGRQGCTVSAAIAQAPSFTFLLPLPLPQVIVRSRQYYKFARSNHISQQILPECTTLDTSSRLLLDRRTGLVVRHEDCWTNKPTFHLPMTWRRVNSVCTHTIWRLLGWGREMAAAEARCDSGGGADSAGPWGDAAAH